jgi:peptide/nickel transport system substrate-binding protein
VPDLAESWEFSDDRKTLTLRLRPGLKYHDGTAFDTKDVYATYDRIINPPKGVASLRKAQFEVVESMEIVDPLTFKFHMSEPKGLMLGMLAMGWNVISSDEFLKEHDYNLRRVDNQPGVGPFKFRTHEQGEIWELDRFDGYWQQPLPYVDGIDCYEFSGQAAGPETTALITGQLDMAVSIAADVGVEILNGERPGLIHSYSVSPFTNGLFFNIAKGAPFDDVRVRYAIHLAINRQQNIEAISRMSSFILGTYIVSNSPYAPTYEELLTWPGYRPDKTEDLAEAKRLMAEAGYPDGFKTRYLSGTGTTNSITSAVYQDNLKDLGIEVEIDLVEGVQYFEEVREGKFHMAKGGVGYTIDDPEDALVTIAHPDAPSNYSRYSNPEVTGLLRELSGAFGFDERKRIGDEILVILEREQPIAMFAYNSRHFPYWDYVHGFPFIGANLYSTARWDSIWLDRPH